MFEEVLHRGIKAAEGEAKDGVGGCDPWEDRGDTRLEDPCLQPRAEEREAQPLGSHLVAVAVRHAGDQPVQA